MIKKLIVLFVVTASLNTVGEILKKITGLLYRQLWDDHHEDELNNKFKVPV